MSKILIYMFPGACSRVTMSALEEIGVDYEDRGVNLAAGQQTGADYLAVNRKGKVPTLEIDGRPLSENAAMLIYLDQTHPEANLLPRSKDALERAKAMSDIIWCSSGLHPMVRQMRNPARFTSGETEGVRADGLKKFAVEATYMAERIGETGWWYGEHWSIVDAYVYWAYSTAAKGSFPLENYPLLIAHGDRVRARPSMQRVLERERRAIERDGLQLDPKDI